MNNLKTYIFPLILLTSILLGGTVGYFISDKTVYLKPIGDIFLNLILVSIVPLVFFSIASAVENMVSAKQFGKVFSSIALSFIGTSFIAALFMILVTLLFPPAQGVTLNLGLPDKIQNINLSDQIVGIFTVKDFSQLFSYHNLLPLIFFAILFGLTVPSVDPNKSISRFLKQGSEIFINLVTKIMYLAPIGFFAYFAYLVSQLGPHLLSIYFRVTWIYCIAAIFYFVIGYTLYAFIAAKTVGVKNFWRNIHLSVLTSLATCSSASSIPANIQSSKKMGVPAFIYESVIPLGAFLHKEGSTLGGALKIAFLFGVFHMHFGGISVIMTAILVSILVGTVMGAIPSGGMLGETLIISLYGFPPESLMIIAAISILIDPLATMLNVTGDCVCNLLVMRLCKNEKGLRIKQGLAIEKS